MLWKHYIFQLLKNIQKKKIINTFKDSKVEFLDTFPEKIIYYYKVENSPQPKLYSVIIIPFLEDNIKGIKITKEAVPSSLKLPGPFLPSFIQEI